MNPMEQMYETNSHWDYIGKAAYFTFLEDMNDNSTFTTRVDINVYNKSHVVVARICRSRCQMHAPNIRHRIEFRRIVRGLQ